MRDFIQGYLLVLVCLLVPILYLFGEMLATFIAIANACFAVAVLQLDSERNKKMQNRRQANSAL